MSKARITISLDAELAARIRSHADRVGIDVSAYLANAVIRQMAETDASNAQFAKVDAMIAEATAQAEALPTVPDPAFDDLTPEQQASVRQAMRLVYGDPPAQVRPHDAA